MNQNEDREQQLKTGIVVRAIAGVLLLFSGFAAQSDVLAVLFYIGFGLMLFSTIYDIITYRKRK